MLKVERREPGVARPCLACFRPRWGCVLLGLKGTRGLRHVILFSLGLDRIHVIDNREMAMWLRAHGWCWKIVLTREGGKKGTDAS